MEIALQTIYIFAIVPLTIAILATLFIKEIKKGKHYEFLDEFLENGKDFKF